MAPGQDRRGLDFVTDGGVYRGSRSFVHYSLEEEGVVYWWMEGVLGLDLNWESSVAQMVHSTVA